jgi:sugar/nucleoside kinase (ribokinase family)
MTFEGRFAEQILPDQLHILNVSFLVPSLRRDFGGCAGNIAYSLKLLGGEPLPMAMLGSDGTEYLQRLESLGEQVLRFMTRQLHAPAGAFYVLERGGMVRRVAGFALAGDPPEMFQPGSGLVGEAVRADRIMDIAAPAEHLRLESALLSAPPQRVVVVPVSYHGRVNGVVELALDAAPDEAAMEMLERSRQTLGIAINASIDRSRLEELLDETQRQSEELQAQQEELRVANEELQGQSDALKSSQVRLEQQQAELESAARGLAGQIAAGPSSVIAAARHVARGRFHAELEEVLELEVQAQLEAFKSSNFREGITAFLEKRAPRFNCES